MQNMYYIGLDVHKRAISYCVKDVSGRVYAEGSVPATRIHLDRRMKTLPQPWTAAMEATVFTGWIYDYLQRLCDQREIPPLVGPRQGIISLDEVEIERIQEKIHTRRVVYDEVERSIVSLGNSCSQAVNECYVVQLR